jgi:cysteine desulfurase
MARYQSVVGNPSSPHAAGRSASVALTEARKAVAVSLGCEPSEIVFVSGGSEANNVATRGVLRQAERSMSELHAVTSTVEHPCVLEPLKHLQRSEGLQLTFLPVDSNGRIRLSDLAESLQPNTALVSVMAANNETGAVQPVREFGDWLNAVRWQKVKATADWRQSGIETWPDWARKLSVSVGQRELQNLHFHVDAVQAYGKLQSAQWLSMGFDSVSVCAHKLGGLAGVGALMTRRGRKFEPLILGGAQERSRRAGTENLMGILSFGAVAESISSEDWWQNVSRTDELRQQLARFLERFAGVLVNTPPDHALPNTVNVCVEASMIKGEDVLMELDMRGFYASSGSACSSAANRPSHVLLAQGRTPEQASNAIRFSLGQDTTEQQIQLLCEALQEIFTRR